MVWVPERIWNLLCLCTCRNSTRNILLMLLPGLNTISCRCDMEEKKDEEDSTLNEGEAEVAIGHAKRLVESGVRASDIGLITPYAAQVSVI